MKHFETLKIHLDPHGFFVFRIIILGGEMQTQAPFTLRQDRRGVAAARANGV